METDRQSYGLELQPADPLNISEFMHRNLLPCGLFTDAAHMTSV